MDPKRSVKTVSASEAAATGLIRGANTAGGAGTAETSASAADKLEAAKRAAAKINLKNTPKGKTDTVETRFQKESRFKKDCCYNRFFST